MKVLLFDPVGGASGDMILGSLIHLGCPPEYLASVWGALPIFKGVGGDIAQSSLKEIHGIAALHIRFALDGASKSGDTRSFKDILNLLDNAPLNDTIRQRAIGIFRCLAEAEGTVHQTNPESVHFHEIGAIDSILDIVGIAAAVEWFHPDSIYTRPPPLGRGITSSLHGSIPVPAPATVQLLKSMRVRFTDMESELTTPTGAAVLKFLAKGVPAPLELAIEGIGYGCGSRTFETWPNLFRSILCKMPNIPEDDTVYIVETDIDDMIPEDLETAFRNLLEAGALDAGATSRQMKKGRPGIELRVIVRNEHLQRIIEVLFNHTTTIGVRYYPVSRIVLPRQIRLIRTPFGNVRIKEITLPDGRKRFKPEMDDLDRISSETGHPVSELRKEVEKEITRENKE